MQDTQCENCPFLAQGFKECPNYIETLWHDKSSVQPQIIRDCAPRRTLLMLQELYNRTFGLQQQISQFENQIFEQRAKLTTLLTYISYIEEQKEIESSERSKMLAHITSFKGEG